MLLIYSEIITPRINYTLNFIFSEVLGIKYNLITDKEVFKNHRQERINYSYQRIDNEFFIKSLSILFENTIEEKHIEVLEKDEMKILFPLENSDLEFDVFAASFYLITRYEEYLPFTADEYGRFPASASLAYKNGFLQIPIVNIWIEKFKNILLQKYPQLLFKQNKFEAIFTYDIDVAYAYKGKSLLRQFGASIKDIVRFKFNNIYNRIAVIGKFKKDPWDIYKAIGKYILQKKMQTIFFFLVGDNSKYDKNLHYKSEGLKEVVSKISSFSEIGIHPSFLSTQKPEKISIEKTRLEEIANKFINKSRQHYLKFTLPDTYNTLIDAGITEDYSMGFADSPGFRAGTCTPFYFYDIKNEKATSLKIFPATCMEVSYIKYLKVDADNALQNILTLINEIKNVNGLFISIWHNDNLSNEGEGKTWKDVHDRMVDAAVTYLHS